MCFNSVLVVLALVICVKVCFTQVIQFGKCADVESVKFFEMEEFLGFWYEIQRFPAWYERYGNCAYKHVQWCERQIEIQHVFVKDEIEFVLHVNSTYSHGDEAVFYIQENSIDPVGIPLSVIATNYKDYAVVYGCKYFAEINLKYVAAWILSRSRTLDEEYIEAAHHIINEIPGGSTAYLETVEQREEHCKFYWTAHVTAQNSSTRDLSRIRNGF